MTLDDEPIFYECDFCGAIWRQRWRQTKVDGCPDCGSEDIVPKEDYKLWNL